MAALTVEGRLLCASNVAYDISDDGNVLIRAEYYEGSGFVTAPVSVCRGPKGIDAALVGKTVDGVVLAFRGTLPGPYGNNPEQTLDDWMQELEFGLVEGAQLPGRVHKGFRSALDFLWDEVSSMVIGQLAGLESRRLLITGHSKGGALANLAAARFASQGVAGGADVAVCTFGAPRPGDIAFANAYRKLVPAAVRYEFRDDIGPHLPPSVDTHWLFRNEPHFVGFDENFDYAPVGELRFIRWDGAIVADSKVLQAERLFHLAVRLAAFDVKEILDEHRIDCGHGYMNTLCRIGVCSVSAPVRRRPSMATDLGP